jgi:hypothetical protein
MLPALESSPVGATNRIFAENEGVTEREAGLELRLPTAFDTTTLKEEPESVEMVPGERYDAWFAPGTATPFLSH